MKLSLLKKTMLATKGHQTGNKRANIKSFLSIKTNLLLLLSLTLFGCSSTPVLKKEASEPLYTSSYTKTPYEVGQYNIKDFTSAPLQSVHVIQFDKPIDEIFNTLLTKVDLYVEDVAKVEFDHKKSLNSNAFGVGTERVCIFQNEEILYEPLVAYEQGKFYAYRVDQKKSTKSMPMADALLFWSFEEKGPNKTLVTVKTYFVPDMFFLMNWMIPSMFDDSMNDVFLKATEEFGGQLIQSNWKR